MGQYIRKSKEERRREIREAAIEIFLQKGYRFTTMEDVVAQTTLSKGGVYRYYSGTREILLDIMKQGNQYRMDLLASLKEKMGAPVQGKELLMAMAKNKIYSDNRYSKLYLMFMSELVYDEEMRVLFHELEQQGIEQFVALLKDSLSEKALEAFKANTVYLFRVLNGVIFIENVFKEEDVLRLHEEKLDHLLHAVFGF